MCLLDTMQGAAHLQDDFRKECIFTSVSLELSLLRSQPCPATERRTGQVPCPAVRTRGSSHPTLGGRSASYLCRQSSPNS